MPTFDQTTSSSVSLFSKRTAHHDGQRLWPISSPVALTPPICFFPRDPHTMCNAPHVRFCRNRRGGARIIYHSTSPISTNLCPTPTISRYGWWKLHVALPPPIRLLPLHTNTMDDAPQRWFCRNRLWGRVIGGVLTMYLKSVLFTHDNQLGCVTLLGVPWYLYRYLPTCLLFIKVLPLPTQR